MSVKAIANNVRMSPRKVGEVVALVRNRTVADALTILEHTPRLAAKPVAKVIASAAANATHNNKLKKDSLYIESIFVGPGTVMKRFRPAAMGRAQPYKRRSSNITVVVSGAESKPAATKTDSKKSTAKPAAKKTESKEKK